MLGVDGGVAGVGAGATGESLEVVLGELAGAVSVLASPEEGGVTDDVALRLSFL